MGSSEADGSVLFIGFLAVICLLALGYVIYRVAGGSQISFLDIMDNFYSFIDNARYILFCLGFAIFNGMMYMRDYTIDEKIITFNSYKEVVDYISKNNLVVPDMSSITDSKYCKYQLRHSLDLGVSFFDYAFKFKDLKDNVSVIQSIRYKTLNLDGKVEKSNGYYKINNTYIKRGLVVLEENSDIVLTIHVPTTSLDFESNLPMIIDDYEVVSVEKLNK